jgi:hypothetical protein
MKMTHERRNIVIFMSALDVGRKSVVIIVAVVFVYFILLAAGGGDAC